MIQNKKKLYTKTSTRGATGASKRRAKNLRSAHTGRVTATATKSKIASATRSRPANAYPMRLNKYLAQMSIASRREADALIEKGLIFVNGKKATLGTKVNKTDTVTLGGEKMSDSNVKKEANRYFAYFKPIGITTTKEVDAKDILSVAKFPVPVFPVGRLDKDSEGLIIMTNDGRVTERLLHPRGFHEKEYRVELNRAINNTLLRGIKSGLHVGGFKARPAQVRKADSPNTMDIILTEGQNRQVRRMVKAFGFNVENLLRFRIENIVIDGLEPGEQREIKGPELEEFLKRLKLLK